MTTTLSSAWSITASTNPPRAAFLDYPLGHTAGPPHDPTVQREVVEAALRLVERSQDQAVIEPLAQQWPSDWRAAARELNDDRSSRHDTPQYDIRS